MADRSHLVRTPITDRTGKQTAVYRKPIQGPAPAATLPPPAVVAQAPSAPSRAEAYAQRLAEIAEDNDKWGPSHPGYHEVLGWANEGLSSLALSAVRGRRSQAEGLARHIGRAYEEQAYSRAVAADVLGGIFGGMFRATGDVDLTDTEQLTDWQYGVSDDCVWSNGVFRVTEALHGLGLLAISTVPEDADALDNKEPGERDLRFMTHLLACAKGHLEYGEPEKHGDFIRLLDEYPEHLAEISAAAAEGLHAAAARARIEDDVHGAVINGAL